MGRDGPHIVEQLTSTASHNGTCAAKAPSLFSQLACSWRLLASRLPTPVFLGSSSSKPTECRYHHHHLVNHHHNNQRRSIGCEQLQPPLKPLSLPPPPNPSHPPNTSRTPELRQPQGIIDRPFWRASRPRLISLLALFPHRPASFTIQDGVVTRPPEGQEQGRRACSDLGRAASSRSRRSSRRGLAGAHTAVRRFGGAPRVPGQEAERV